MDSMHTICVSTLKGGEGKSSVAILLAQAIASRGKKVLVIDLDPQNSTSYFFNSSVDARNVAAALYEGDMAANIIPEVMPNIDLCQSDLNLFKLRSMAQHTLKVLLDQVSSKYQYCVIDTAPTWDNIVMNGVFAADLILLPARLKSTFSVKTCKFYRQLLNLEMPGAVKRLALFYNFYKLDGEAEQYISLWEQTHDNFFDSSLPQTSQIKEAIDFKKPVTDLKKWDILNPFLDSLYTEIEGYFNPVSVTTSAVSEVE